MMIPCFHRIYHILHALLMKEGNISLCLQVKITILRFLKDSNFSKIKETYDNYKSPEPVSIYLVLIKYFKRSPALNYVLHIWRKVKVVFIPKSGRDCIQAKDYRPKTIEKLIENHIKQTSLLKRPLHPINLSFN